MSATVICKTPHGRRIVTDLSSALPAAARDQARVDANQWIKDLRLAPYDGAPMRQRFTYRGDSLWWFTELYLHKMRRIDTAISTILALEAIAAEHQPVRLSVETTDATIQAAARAFSQASAVPVDVIGTVASRRKLGWPSFAIGFNARLSRLRSARTIDRRPAVAAFVHTAFWQPAASTDDGPAQESYVGAVLNAVAAQGRESDLFCVGVGPRRNFRARRWWDPVAASGGPSRLITPIERLAPNRALKDSYRLWTDRRHLANKVTEGTGIRDAARYHGCDLWPVLERELEAVALLQWPWSARAMDEAGAALDLLEPGAAVTYAEAGGWGRAMVLEARRRHIPSIGLQHGFIYRHWLNYRHRPDEFAPIGRDAGCPVPDRTLVFDRYAEATLLEAGHFPADRVAVTGNARLDDLAAQFATLQPIRGSIRQELGADRPLAVLAAKFSEIRHVLGDLTEAVAGLPEMRLIIKPHPAETPDVYTPAAGGIANITIAPARADLARLLVAADAIVTMNSTVAIDALVLGVPALVIGLPNNLSPFVDAGAMAGAAGPAEIRERLRSLLYDQDARRNVIAAGEAFARRYELRSDGHAARRAASAILAMAAHPSAHRGGNTK